MSFTDAVEEAAEYAKTEAESVTGGDPGTMVSAEVDGRSGFAQNMKKYGTQSNNGWEIGPVKMTEDYGLMVNVLEGTDTQLHKKKIRALRAFGEKMSELGYNCSVDVNTYAY